MVGLCIGTNHSNPWYYKCIQFKTIKDMKNTGKVIFILIVLSFVAMASTCKNEDENHHRTIEVINNSEKAIYANFDFAYPDTLAPGVPSSSEPSIYKVEPHERNTSALWQRDFWELIFRDFRYEKQIPSDTLMVFIFDVELLDSHTTHINNTVIQRYDLSLQDLQRINWTLTYPPSPNMSAIKMYPPYGSE
jgi:hypothetical protein